MYLLQFRKDLNPQQPVRSGPCYPVTPWNYSSQDRIRTCKSYYLNTVVLSLHQYLPQRLPIPPPDYI